MAACERWCVCVWLSFLLVYTIAEGAGNNDETTLVTARGGIPSTVEKNNRVGDEKKCSDGLKWNVKGGTLTISGAGKMCDYDAFNKAPWDDDHSSITSIVVNEGVKSIGSYAFNGCFKATVVSIPSTVTSIGKSAFDSCSKLTQFTVKKENSQFKSLGGVLIDQKSKTLVRYPEGKTDTTYTIPDVITTIGDYAFRGCDHLTTVILPSNVKTIGTAAFIVCSGLTSITLSSSLSKIKSLAFSYCSKLKSIELPASLLSINPNAFEGCSGLESINVQSGNSVYFSVDGVLFNTTSKALALVRYPPGNASTLYTIPSNVEIIGEGAFRFCDNLHNVVIPESVKSIETYAFTSKGLEYIVIPESVTSIGDYAFYGCSNMSSVFYQGSTAIKAYNVFSSCDALNAVCVSPNYSSSRFCEKTLSERCVDNPKNKKHWAVQIELEENNLTVVDINRTTIAEDFNAITGLNEEVIVGLEYDRNGFVLRVVLFIDVEEKADYASEVLLNACKEDDTSENMTSSSFDESESSADNSGSSADESESSLDNSGSGADESDSNVDESKSGVDQSQ